MSEEADSIGRDTAIEFVKRIDNAMKSLGDAGEALRPSLAKDHFRIFAEAFGAAVSELDLGVLEIIYRCHPDLRPSDMPRGRPLEKSKMENVEFRAKRRATSRSLSPIAP